MPPQPPDAYLIVVKGIVLEDGVALSGAALPLWKKKVLLGRASPDRQPDFPFCSPFVSRQHATIEHIDEVYYLTDLPGNRHGTRINEKRLTPGIPYEIKDRDRIGLAKDEVVLIFATSASMGGETWDFPPPEPPTKPILVLDHDRREVTLDGEVLAPPLIGKLYDLLRLLYDNRGRGMGADGEPMVTHEELTTLVYRLRERLKPHGDLIRRVRGYGDMLDLPR
jgi:hypothetical protein